MNSILERKEPTMRPRHQAEIYSDGGCNSRTGKGAWACIVRCNGEDKEICGYDPKTTNNRMEMTAALAGLEYLTTIRVRDGDKKIVPRTVLLVSDSQLLLNGISWIDGWKKRARRTQTGSVWRTADGSSVKNQDLWEQMEVLKYRFRITTRWVRGHSGHPENERCDAMCTEAMRQHGRERYDQRPAY